jgi:hypothetical protein
MRLLQDESAALCSVLLSSAVSLLAMSKQRPLYFEF